MVSGSDCSIFLMALSSGFSKWVPRYCWSAFSATTSAKSSPSVITDVQEGADFLGIGITIFAGIEFNWQTQPVAHEFDVAVDGFGGHLDFPRERGGVGKPAGGKGLMDAQHALQ